jgi:hypothetical protein
MQEVRLENTTGEAIRSVSDWLRLAPPKKGKDQWEEGRSAMELAKAWFRDARSVAPAELVALLTSNQSLSDAKLERGVAEKVTLIDEFAGEHRNHDLILFGTCGAGSVAVGLEAKVDEEFGPVVGPHLESAPQRSNIPSRVSLLTASLFGRALDDRLRTLRYQLLTATAGTMIEAGQHKASAAVLVVWEFVTHKWASAKSEANSADWRRFLENLPGAPVAAAQPGVLAGPLSLPGGRFVPNGIPLYVGKIVTKV